MSKRNAQCLRKLHRWYLRKGDDYTPVDFPGIHVLLLCPDMCVDSTRPTETVQFLEQLCDSLREEREFNAFLLSELGGLVTSTKDLVDIGRVVNLAVLVRTPECSKNCTDDVETVLEQFDRGASVGVPVEERIVFCLRTDVADAIKDRIEQYWGISRSFEDENDLLQTIRSEIDNVARWETIGRLPTPPGHKQNLLQDWCEEFRAVPDEL